MFWGLIMEPGRCYSQEVQTAFHVSMAALDLSNATGGEPIQVMCVFENRNYLLCTLDKSDKLQCALDLNFDVGTKVSFATNGNGNVHLTGYLINTDENDDDDDANEEEQEVEEESEAPVKEKTRKTSVEEPPKKKLKKAKPTLAALQNTIDEEHSSDSDFDMEKIEAEDDDDDDESETGEQDSGEEDEEAEDEEDESDDENEDKSGEEDENDDESEEEEKVEEKPKLNGFALKQKKAVKEDPKELKKKGRPDEKLKPTTSTRKGGVTIQDLKQGNGQPVSNGKNVHVYYEGRLQDTNKVFDSTTKGAGFSFKLGGGQVIKGWDIGLVGMKVGGKRRIVCPPKVAYGPRGSPPVIPGNATLVFDVELRKVS